MTSRFISWICQALQGAPSPRIPVDSPLSLNQPGRTELPDTPVSVPEYVACHGPLPDNRTTYRTTYLNNQPWSPSREVAKEVERMHRALESVITGIGITPARSSTRVPIEVSPNLIILEGNRGMYASNAASIIMDKQEVSLGHRLWHTLSHELTHATGHHVAAGKRFSPHIKEPSRSHDGEYRQWGRIGVSLSVTRVYPIDDWWMFDTTNSFKGINEGLTELFASCVRAYDVSMRGHDQATHIPIIESYHERCEDVINLLYATAGQQGLSVMEVWQRWLTSYFCGDDRLYTDLSTLLGLEAFQELGLNEKTLEMVLPIAPEEQRAIVERHCSPTNYPNDFRSFGTQFLIETSKDAIAHSTLVAHRFAQNFVDYLHRGSHRDNILCRIMNVG